MTVRIPHCSTAAFIASRPAVKLRFTGTTPRSVRPRLTSAPPTVEGSSTPTIVVRGSERLTSTAPVSISP